MTDFVTHEELNAAIAVVTDDLRDTENRLRTEFTGTVRYEVGKIDRHLETQDNSLKWINRWALGALVTVLAAVLVYAVH